MANKAFFAPTDALVYFYLNTAKGQAPTEYQLRAPRCIVNRVTQCVAPETGEADISLYLGNGMSDYGATNNTRGAVLENYLGNTGNLEDFIAALSNAWVKIQVPNTDTNSTTFISSQQGDFREPLPQNASINVDDYMPDSWKTIFVGYIWQINRDFGNLSQTAELKCVDIGAWMNTRSWQALAQTIYSFSESTSVYNPIAFDNLPDFNQLVNGNETWNMDDNGKQTWNYNLPDYTINVTSSVFNEVDVEQVVGSSNRQRWGNQDIVDLVFDYINGWYASLWQGIGVTVAFADTTGNFQNSLTGTFSSRQEFWKLLNDVCDRKKGFVLWWSYSAGSGSAVTATLNLGYAADAVMGGYNPLAQLDYTLAGGWPVGFYSEKPAISTVSNDDYGYVRVFTLPTSLVYTFNLGNNFYEGYNTAMEPSDDEILEAGANSKYYSRFVLDTTVLYKMSTSNVKSSGFQTEPWAETGTPIGVQFTPTSTTDAAAVTTMSVLHPQDFYPCPTTVKIATTVPVTQTDPTLNSNSTNSPILFFISNAPDDASNVELSTGEDLKVSMKHCDNVITINPDQTHFDIFKDKSDRQNYYMTMMVEDTPPLWIQFSKDVINNEASILNIVHQYKPTFILNNTVAYIDQDGVPQLVTPNTDGIAQFRDDSGLVTLESLYTEMTRIAQFFLRIKNKCDWAISNLDPSELLGQFMTTIDVPTIIQEDPTVPGIGAEQYVTVTVNTVVSKIVWDFHKQETHYFTDFKNYIKGY